MDKIFFVALCALLVLGGCKPDSKQKGEQDTVTKTENQETQEKGPIELTTVEFKKRVVNYEAHPDKWVFEGKRPAVIDFYATWCGPCKLTAPIFAELASTYTGKVDFYKVDIDKQPELAALFNISSIPTLLFIPLEGTPSISVGAMDKQQMQEALHEYLSL